GRDETNGLNSPGMRHRRNHRSQRASRLTPGTLKSYFRPKPKISINGAHGESWARDSGEPSALLIRRQTRLSRGVKGILVTGIIVTTLVTSVAAACGVLTAMPMRIRTRHCLARKRPTPRMASPIACAYATDVISQFNVTAGKSRRLAGTNVPAGTLALVRSPLALRCSREQNALHTLIHQR